MRRIAIIPARGGSKRVPNKNFRDFFGRPIIAYTLEVVRRADLFDVVHVSTDSPQIVDFVNRSGFPVDFPRPPALADDHTPIRDVLKFVIRTYRARGSEFDVVFRISACAPLLEADDLRRASALFDSIRGLHPILSVTTYPAPIESAYEAKPDMTLTAVNADLMRVRSQDLTLKYHDAGLFSILPVELVDLHPVPYPRPFIGYPVPRERAVDINSMEDWNVAARLFAGARLDVHTHDASKRMRFVKTSLEIPIALSGSLRPLSPADVTPAYVDCLREQHVNGFIESSRQQTQTYASFADWVEANWADDKAILFGMYTGRTLRGTVWIHDIDWTLEAAKIGIVLFDVSDWSNGIAPEAIQAATRCACDLFGLHHLRAGINPDNAASIRTFEKAGYVRTDQPRPDVHELSFWSYE